MDIVNRHYPQRIVCLTEETTELLYLLGEQERIVGISGFTVRPPRARKEKPKVSAFTSAKIDRILDLEPDLVLGFSDLQADIAAQLIRAGVAVHIFNQRSVAGIFEMMWMLGAMVGAADRTARLIDEMQQGLAAIEQSARALPRRPRILFEEWNEPLISAIGWVSELIGIAGGEDCFAELGRERSAKGRIIADPTEVVRRAPDIIIGSWCGKRFRPEQVRAREGWDSVPAVHHGQLHEIKSCDILQPGPAALTDGVRQLHEIIRRWAASQD
ncbi:cobalamin-binding protein [Sedimenticola hydrogenitrophicus]|uniref:cobalamin-binding protein n=1 Tax=Sedimenticola hydrogenitrophicus TaxID=2967975 RepID=UPI0023B09095|nr:cobalamin-binding protein [Sedimenticola hydrogenitrophicus]